LRQDRLSCALFSFTFLWAARSAARRFFLGGGLATQENVLTKTDDFIKSFLPKIENLPRN
jgi:hypothetical protein